MLQCVPLPTTSFLFSSRCASCFSSFGFMPSFGSNFRSRGLRCSLFASSSVSLWPTPHSGLRAVTFFPPMPGSASDFLRRLDSIQISFSPVSTDRRFLIFPPPPPLKAPSFPYVRTIFFHPYTPGTQVLPFFYGFHPAELVRASQ